MVSRVLGLVRDVVWLSMIPAASRGAFIVAFKFPNMLRDLIGEGASNAAFVPVFSESLEKGNDKEHRDLVSATMSAMLIVLAVLTLLGILIVPALLQGADLLSPLTGAPKVDHEDFELTVTLARWVFPYIFLIGMAVFCMGGLFSLKHYATPSWSPALLNVAIIVCCLAFRNSFDEPAYALVIGVWLGGIAQLCVNYVALGKCSGVWLPSFKLLNPGVWKIAVLLLPVLIGQAAGEVNKLVDTMFAYSLGADAVTALYAANRLVQLPLAMFGMAVAVAILPSVSRAGARKDYAEIRSTLMSGLRQSSFLVLPAMIGLIVMRKPIVQLIFERGEFASGDTERAATALAFYGAGLLSFAWVKVLVSGFYAVQNTKTPVIVASVSMLLNILLNCALVGPMKFKGLALATTISFTVNFLLLYVLLSNRFGNLWNKEFWQALLKICVATLTMAAVVLGLYLKLRLVFAEETLSGRALCTLIPITAGCIIYAILSYALRISEMGEFMSVFKRKSP